MVAIQCKQWFEKRINNDVGKTGCTKEYKKIPENSVDYYLNQSIKIYHVGNK